LIVGGMHDFSSKSGIVVRMETSRIQHPRTLRLGGPPKGWSFAIYERLTSGL
jgi:hypothetical protein